MNDGVQIESCGGDEEKPNSCKEGVGCCTAEKVLTCEGNIVVTQYKDSCTDEITTVKKTVRPRKIG